MKTLAVSFRLVVVLVAGCLSAASMVAETVAPEVSLSFRGVSGGTVEQGEPLSVTVLLAVPPHSGATIELAPAAGRWTDAVSVELTKAGDATVLARATVVGRSDSPRITLEPQHPAGGLWLFSSAGMELPPGDYAVNVHLTIDAGTGWLGLARSSAWPLKVVALSSSDPARVSQRTLAKASEAVVGGKLEEAAAILDAQLKLTPDDRPLLLLRAVLAEQAGNLAAALLCVNRASRGLSSKGPPPADLYVLRTRLQAKMLEAPSADATAAPPAWSWPPEILLASRPEAEAEVPQKTPPVPVAAQATATPTQASQPNPPSSEARPPVGSPNPAVRVPLAPAGPPPGVIVPGPELSDAKIVPDAAGQWATAATASSQYGAPRYAPAQATGVPNIPLGMAGDNPDAWCPAEKNEGTAWLELAFATPVHASEVRVRQNNAPGAIAKVELIEADGTSHVVWEGRDPFVAPAVREIAWFAVRVPKTAYLVTKVKLTLNLAAVQGWKQIDAVQLVGEAD